ADQPSPAPKPDATGRDVDWGSVGLELLAAGGHLPPKHANHRVRRDEGGPPAGMRTSLRRLRPTALSRARGKTGQAIGLLALTATLLIGGIGVAVDVGDGYTCGVGGA